MNDGSKYLGNFSAKVFSNMANLRLFDKISILNLRLFEIYRALVHAKQVGEKRGKIQKPVKIAHKAVVLIFLSL